MKNYCYIKTYYGYGDNIWQYPFIEKASKIYKKVYLETYFPFLFNHIPNIILIKPKQKTKLHTCTSILEKYSHLYSNESFPSEYDILQFPYYLTEFKKNRNMITSFNSVIQLQNKDLQTSLFISNKMELEAQKYIDKWKEKGKIIALIRPPTNRKDWDCSARIPKPEYFQYLINTYNKDVVFVSIGNKTTDNYIQDLDNIDYRYDNGELSLELINAIASLSDLIITYNCFMFPLGVYTGTPTFIINGGYTNPNLYIDAYRMNLNHIRIVTPTIPCNCVDLNHNCNKEIDYSNLIENFEILLRTNNIPIKDDRKNLLISRLRAYRCKEIASNPTIAEKFKIFTVDHTDISEYENEPLFEKSYQFNQIGNILNTEITGEQTKQAYDFCKDILKENKINYIINAQPLHPYHNILEQVAKELKIETINYETFFDDKLILDKIGCQYTKYNEINLYVDKVNDLSDIKIDLPKNSRDKQPNNLPTPRAFFRKYRIDNSKPYIVIFGQLLWDMSLKQSINSQIKNPVDFYEYIFKNNPSTNFLFKCHPKYTTQLKKRDLAFLENYKNVTIVDESLKTLFDACNLFISFSSSCILEGLIKNKKFATIGYHFCNHPELVYQLDTLGKFENIYESLNNFNFNKTLLNKYLYFICNKYTLSMNSKNLANRILLSSEDYFKEVDNK